MAVTVQDFKNEIWITHKLSGKQFYYQNGGYVSCNGEKAILCELITAIGFMHDGATYLFKDFEPSTNISKVCPHCKKKLF